MNRNELDFAVSDLGTFAQAFIALSQDLHDGKSEHYTMVKFAAEPMHGLYVRMEAALAEGEEPEQFPAPRVVK